jgi:hypothetical protein
MYDFPEKESRGARRLSVSSSGPSRNLLSDHKTLGGSQRGNVRMEKERPALVREVKSLSLISFVQLLLSLAL